MLQRLGRILAHVLPHIVEYELSIRSGRRTESRDGVLVEYVEGIACAECLPIVMDEETCAAVPGT